MTAVNEIPMKQMGLEKDGRLPVVAIDKVYKSFGEHKILNGITLNVSRGETLAVLGRSGTGKSVLLRLIIGLDHPDEGSIRIDRKSVV